MTRMPAFGLDGPWRDRGGFAQTMEAIAGIAWDGSNERFVAVGTDADGRPHAWLTADGTDWTSIQLGNEAAMVTGVVSSDGLTVASGAVDYDSPARATIVWSSFDGLSWWYGTVLNGRIGAVEAATEVDLLLHGHAEHREVVADPLDGRVERREVTEPGEEDLHVRTASGTGCRW